MEPTAADLVTWLDAGSATLLEHAGDLTRLGSDDLAGLAAGAAKIVNAAKALQAAVVMEARERGVIAASDNPKTAAWVEQSCRDAGVPLAPAQARGLDEVSRTCSTPDVARLKDAVVAGECTVESAAIIASTYRRLSPKVDVRGWDTVLDQLIGWLGEGATRKNIAEFEDVLLSQYGTETTLEDEHEQKRSNRTMSALTLNSKTGMFESKIVMDPVNEAVFSAALHALSKPHVDPDTGEHDPRTPGTRRLDALVTMAKHATNPDKTVRGSGAAARIIVTIPLADLVGGLRRTSLAEQLGLFPAEAEATAGAHVGAFAATATDSDTPAACDRGNGQAGTSGHAGANGHDQCCDQGPLAPGSVGVLATGDLGHHTIRSSVAGCGTTRYGQVLSPADVRMLACDAQIIPAVLGTRSELLDLGHAHRLAKPGLVTALELRDKTCTYPGCRMPAAWTDKHHLIHWANGGPTTEWNMACVCRHHHTVIHRHGHIGTVTPNGVRWTRADGTPIGNQLRPDATSDRKVDGATGGGANADAHGSEPSPSARTPERIALPSEQPILT
ncbi:hypothetical protein BJY21_001657 [Kineosphaera limosa]|uniref:HNH endonuclease signature motif containing protein n=2 Tax=Kineosphaera limosa TaxID=111564 RepID=UPI0015CEC7F4|nr:HNH endonuclease signature motif containing protein [Kineosphaera limosa]NYE00473.1 hypothetical protein [Kineosphaera limosa]